MTYLSAHLTIMILALLAKTGAVAVARFLRKRPWWLKVHRFLNWLTLGALAVGLAFGVLLTLDFGEFDSGLAHRVLGFVGIVAAALLALLGTNLLKGVGKGGKEALKSKKGLHRWAGRLAYLLMPLIMVLGYLVARDMGLL